MIPKVCLSEFLVFDQKQEQTQEKRRLIGTQSIYIYILYLCIYTLCLYACINMYNM